MKRMYLALFCLRQVREEHRKLEDVIRAASAGSYTRMLTPNGPMFLYESELLPWQVSFDRILHNDDSLVMVEVGEATRLDGFSAAAGWLNARRPRK
ncbi:MAG: hypothetical protein WCS09_02895 [Pseudomonadota bacterium]|jgi:hypothetical protein